MADGKSPLPPGWEQKFDSRSGKHYYINHSTKTTSWEDPREKYPREIIIERPKPMQTSSQHVQQSSAGAGYLKSVFPTVAESLLLDVLANSENNVQKVADKLEKMGYVKAPYDKQGVMNTRIESPLGSLLSNMREDSGERNQQMEQIMSMVTGVTEERERPKQTTPKHAPAHTKSSSLAKPRITNKRIETTQISQGPSTQAERPVDTECNTIAKGPNKTLRKGPNDDLLLTENISRNGPNLELRTGPNRAGAKGPNPEFRKGPSSGFTGPNAENRKGPQGLAKGSIYSSLKADRAALRAI